VIISDEQLKQELPYEISEKYKNTNCTFSCEDCKWTFKKEYEEPCKHCINNLPTEFSNKWEPDEQTERKCGGLKVIFRDMLKSHTLEELIRALDSVLEESYEKG
jgi:hypothetical protein